MIMKLLKNIISFLLLTIVLSIKTYSQVGIGTTKPSDATLLQIGELNATGGIKIPSVNLSSLNNKAPITGDIQESLLVYNTNENLPDGTGFYYWLATNTRWVYISNGTNNLYVNNGTLSANRTLTAANSSLSLLSNTGQNSFILKKENSTYELGFGFRNSGNFYDASIVLGSGTGAPLTFYTGGNNSSVDILTPTLSLNSDKSINLPAYGKGVIGGNLTNYLGINTSGSIVELSQAISNATLNNDWYKAGTINPPEDINDNIYTNGSVFITDRTTGYGTLNVYDPNGEVAGFNSGTILLERNDNTENSIVFKSAINSDSDSGYIRYFPSTSNGSGARNVFEFGVTNDSPNTNVQDDININSSGSLGINTNTPAQSASLDMGRTNQGIRINRVALTSTTDATTVIGTEQDGLLIYNTATAGTGLNAVTEGFYYWDNNKWNPIKYNASTPTMGMQYYSYNIPTSTSPDLFTIETGTVASKMGYYTGNLTDVSGFPIMKPANDNGFIIKMTGSLNVENSGLFNFVAAADDGYRIFIDGSLVVNFWSDASGGNDNNATGNINLKKGVHKVVIYYFQYIGPSRFKFSWGNNPDGKSGTIKATDFFIK